MGIVPVQSAKLMIPFKAGNLPRVSPDSPVFELLLGDVRITVRISAKSARKLGVHPGGAVLQGRLVVDRGKLTLLEAGFTWCDPKPIEAEMVQDASGSTLEDKADRVIVQKPAERVGGLASRVACRVATR